MLKYGISKYIFTGVLLFQFSQTFSSELIDFGPRKSTKKQAPAAKKTKTPNFIIQFRETLDTLSCDAQMTLRERMITKMDTTKNKKTASYYQILVGELTNSIRVHQCAYKEN